VGPGPVWTGAASFSPTGIRSPDRPARSQSLYRLSYRAHTHFCILFKCCLLLKCIVDSMGVNFCEGESRRVQGASVSFLFIVRNSVAV
jgi:hypothetical protein